MATFIKIAINCEDKFCTGCEHYTKEVNYCMVFYQKLEKIDKQIFRRCKECLIAEKQVK